MIMDRFALRLGITLLAGIAGGTAFQAAGLPLPWVLGAAMAAMVLNGARKEWLLWPRLLSDAGAVVVAYLLGSTITPATALRMAADLPGMVAAASLWVAVCIAGGLLFARLARLSETDAVLGCVPGGLTQMVLVAADTKGADPGTVALLQTSRLVVVLYTVPFLAAVFADPAVQAAASAPAAAAPPAEAVPQPGGPAGWGLLLLMPLAAWAARRLRVPAGEFLGPALAAGAFATAGLHGPAVPGFWLGAAQLCMGLYVGSRIQPLVFWRNKRLGPLALLAAGGMVLLTVAAAWALSRLGGSSAVTWFLSLAPGGLGEMAVTALLLGADVPQVTAYQMFRLLFVLLAAPPVLRLVLARRGATRDGRTGL